MPKLSPIETLRTRSRLRRELIKQGVALPQARALTHKKSDTWSQFAKLYKANMGVNPAELSRRSAVPGGNARLFEAINRSEAGQGILSGQDAKGSPGPSEDGEVPG